MTWICSSAAIFSHGVSVKAVLVDGNTTFRYTVFSRGGLHTDYDDHIRLGRLTSYGSA